MLINLETPCEARRKTERMIGNSDAVLEHKDHNLKVHCSLEIDKCEQGLLYRNTFFALRTA